MPPPLYQPLSDCCRTSTVRKLRRSPESWPSALSTGAFHNRDFRESSEGYRQGFQRVPDRPCYGVRTPEKQSENPPNVKLSHRQRYSAIDPTVDGRREDPSVTPWTRANSRAYVDTRIFLVPVRVREGSGKKNKATVSPSKQPSIRQSSSK